MRVPVFLQDHQVAYKALVHPPAYTSQRRAKHLGVSGKNMAKCILLAGPNKLLLAVMPATRRIDMDKLNSVLEQPVRFATQAEIAETFRDCEWGVLMPFGSLYGLTTLLDQSFDSNADIVFVNHLHACAIRMRCRDYEELENPRRLCFSERGR